MRLLMMCFLVASACFLLAPLQAIQNHRQDVVSFDGKKAIQINIPLLTYSFGIVEFVSENKHEDSIVSIGLSRPVIKVIDSSNHR